MIHTSGKHGVPISEQPVNPILEQLRLSEDGDVFGNAMGWIGALADHLTFVMYQNTPEEWGYRPSFFGPDTEAPEYEMLSDLYQNDMQDTHGREDLWLQKIEHAGRVLNRLIDWYEHTGRSY